MKRLSLFALCVLIIHTVNADPISSCIVKSQLFEYSDKSCIQSLSLPEEILRALCDANTDLADSTSGSAKITYTIHPCEQGYIGYCEQSIEGAGSFRTYAYTAEGAKNIEMSCKAQLMGPSKWVDTK